MKENFRLKIISRISTKSLLLAFWVRFVTDPAAKDLYIPHGGDLCISQVKEKQQEAIFNKVSIVEWFKKIDKERPMIK